MQLILSILAVVILYNCGDYIPDSIKHWWENSALREWFHPAFTVILTIAVALGIHYDVLNWGAIVIPAAFGLPYIYGMVLGIWYNNKSAGLKVTSKDEVDAKEIIIKCLKELGCQPQTNDDGALSVQYQGENFQMEFGGRYVRVWDPGWSTVNAEDPEMPNIREAVNATNFNFGPTIVLTPPNEEGIIVFHSRRDIMLHPACPDNVDFVHAVLDSFFITKENMRENFQQIKMQQVEAQKNRRTVGFTTNKS